MDTKPNEPVEKKAIESKTIRVNAAAIAVMELLRALGIEVDYAVITPLLALGNMLLRLVTSSKITS